jgi:hypothetical protein
VEEATLASSQCKLLSPQGILSGQDYGAQRRSESACHGAAILRRRSNSAHNAIIAGPASARRSFAIFCARCSKKCVCSAPLKGFRPPGQRKTWPDLAIAVRGGFELAEDGQKLEPGEPPICDVAELGAKARPRAARALVLRDLDW